ncbi:hypothetical protein [uncultured Gimesia sp.]|uniref:hypothetical protein n=1 Tax=uncultured Gimesia sp. TaxID=1678688 RepID=UPI0030D866F1|tara:strand:+ start:39655 stop:40155 length:501 start_codon:yes stop_codon:yes gene_type:complete
MTVTETQSEGIQPKIGWAAIGFVGSYVFLAYAFMFLGLLQLETDLTWPEERMKSFMLWLTFALACGFGLFTAFFGSIRISRFWLWFFIVFSLISLLQVVPENGRLQVDLNRIWPRWTIVSLYVQSQFHVIKLIILAIHVSLSLGIAWCIHSGWRRLFQPRTTRTST